MNDDEANEIALSLDRMIDKEHNPDVRRRIVLAKIELRTAQCLALRDAAVAREAAT